MKVLVIGGGGREHALAWRLAQDTKVSDVLVYPGNAGMRGEPKLRLIQEAVDFNRALTLVRAEGISLVVIGPEKYLFEGWVDQFRAVGVPAYGPTRAASFLEESKIKSKIFMRSQNISTADFEVVHNLGSALDAIQAHPEWEGYVLKLSGPALGKGVIVTRSAEEAGEAAAEFFKHRPPGIDEGMIIENLISGREVSLFYVCQGTEFQFLASACDHKRLKEGDQGPNTGGMGAYSPCHWIDEPFLRDAEKNFVIPTLTGMVNERSPFSGTLFLGLMVSEQDVSLLEYNTRFGDPETQAFLPLIEGDFSELLLASAQGSNDLSKSKIRNRSAETSVHVVKASRGYPGLFGEAIESGILISNIFDETEGSAQAFSKWFFAGVKSEEGNLITSGGRVCGITARSDSLTHARKLAYQQIHQLSFSGEQFRRDIGGSQS